MKLQASPALEPRAGWRDSVRQARAAVAELLEASPSLRRTLADVIARETPRAISVAAGALADHGEAPRIPLDTLRYGVVQVTGTYFPPNPEPE